MSDVTRIKVLLVDDNLLFRDELVPRLEGEEDIEVVGEASNASEALDKVDRLNPDVVLMKNKDAGYEWSGMHKDDTTASPRGESDYPNGI